MTVSSVLDAAGRQRSPATLPGYHAGRPPRNKGRVYPADPRRGSLLVRNGKGDRRREIGMDAWGWEQLRPWLDARLELPVGPLFCVIDGPTRGRPWSSANARVEFRRHAAQAGIRRRFAPHQLRHAQPSSSPARACRST
jgi:site-specific recombinase XerD